MATNHPPQHQRWTREARPAVSAALAAILVAATLLLGAGVAGSSTDGCGEFSYGFAGTRLINDGISTSAGPFAIALPAGYYEITLVSHDDHPSADYQTDQTAEQWYVRLDNGFVSAPSADIPNDQEWMTTVLPAQDVPAASAISVQHLLSGTSPNSVNVMCVGFTSVERPAPTTTTTTTVSPDPIVAPPTSTEVSTPTTVKPAVPATTTIPPEVKGKVEPPAELAVTGAGDLIAVLAALGASLIVSGSVLVRRPRRAAR